MQGEATKSRIELINREKLYVDGVNGILTFDETYVLLDTSFGDMYVEGSGLVVEDLSKETKKISISGNIKALGFSERKNKKAKKGML